MIDVLLKTLPFFALIAIGYGAARSRFFSEDATAALTKFVFYFALSAMIFRFAATLSFGELFDVNLLFGYLAGCGAAYGVATAVAFMRGQDGPTAAVEAQCFAIGNVGFLGLPMMAVFFGEASIAPMMLILSVDLVVFSSLIVILINLGRGNGITLATLWRVLRGLLANPMILSITAGLLWSGFALAIPDPAAEFLSLLAGAAVPGALFAIGASLASKSAERIEVALWLSFGKLVVHPLCVAGGVLWLMPVDPFAAKIAIAASALPVAGNIYILAQHYGIAPQRVSAAILISTLLAVLSLPVIITWVSAL